jgi:citrate lyase subunit beta/citryl-CoA lyase
MIPIRSPLFVPGNRANMLEKAMALAPDVLIPDLEDSVPVGEKESARSTVSSLLPRLARAAAVVIPRVNAAYTGLMEDDLAAVIGPHIYGVTVGKVGDSGEVRRIASIVDRVEKEAGLETGGIKLVPWIETAGGVVHAYEICSASPRVVAVAFGGEDYANDMAIERTEGGAELAYPRSVVCVAARAAGVQALDTPYVAFRDPEGLRRDALTARGLGFVGKFAIHPSQIGIINDVFTPSDAEIERARRVVAAFEEAERSGRASTSLDGKMIDVPVVRRARSLLELAEKSR